LIITSFIRMGDAGGWSTIESDEVRTTLGLSLQQLTMTRVYSPLSSRRSAYKMFNSKSSFHWTQTQYAPLGMNAQAFFTPSPSFQAQTQPNEEHKTNRPSPVPSTE
jgi:hypothetical protein